MTSVVLHFVSGLLVSVVTLISRRNLFTLDASGAFANCSDEVGFNLTEIQHHMTVQIPHFQLRTVKRSNFVNIFF